ncbi:hypothetical protein [Methylocystis sp.]|uniref:hypothetical protein n=1 Tax=Methylocystis sp. TaxID=1911079 RepID=UPI003DA2CB8E
MVDPQKVEDAGELRVAFLGPAYAANRFFVSIGTSGVRIAFTEQWSEDAPPEFRCAAIVPLIDAIQLKNLLVQMLDPVEAQIAKMEGAKGKADG